MTKAGQTQFERLIRARLASKSFLSVYPYRRSGRLVADHIEICGLMELFGSDLLDVFEPLQLEPQLQTYLYDVADLLDDLITDWFLGLSDAELVRLLPEEEFKFGCCSESHWVTALLD